MQLIKDLMEFSDFRPGDGYGAELIALIDDGLDMDGMLGRKRAVKR